MAKTKRSNKSRGKVSKNNGEASERYTRTALLRDAWIATGCRLPTRGELGQTVFAAYERYRRAGLVLNAPSEPFRVDRKDALHALANALPFTYQERERINDLLRRDDVHPQDIICELARWRDELNGLLRAILGERGNIPDPVADYYNVTSTPECELLYILETFFRDASPKPIQARYARFGWFLRNWLAKGSCFDREMFCRIFDAMGIDLREMPWQGRVHFIRSGRKNPIELFVWEGRKHSVTLIAYRDEFNSDQIVLDAAFHPGVTRYNDVVANLRGMCSHKQRHSASWLKAEQHPFDIVCPGALGALRDHYALRAREPLSERIQTVLKSSNIEL